MNTAPTPPQDPSSQTPTQSPVPWDRHTDPKTLLPRLRDLLSKHDPWRRFTHYQNIASCPTPTRCTTPFVQRVKDRQKALLQNDELVEALIVWFQRDVQATFCSPYGIMKALQAKAGELALLETILNRDLLPVTEKPTPVAKSKNAKVTPNAVRAAAVPGAASGVHVLSS